MAQWSRALPTLTKSMITGELRRYQGTRATVIAGTVANGGSLRVRITAVGEQTALSGIMRLVATAQASSSPTQSLPIVQPQFFFTCSRSGAITFAYWWFSGTSNMRW